MGYMSDSPQAQELAPHAIVRSLIHPDWPLAKAVLQCVSEGTQRKCLFSTCGGISKGVVCILAGMPMAFRPEVVPGKYM